MTRQGVACAHLSLRPAVLPPFLIRAHDTLQQQKLNYYEERERP